MIGRDTGVVNKLIFLANLFRSPNQTIFSRPFLLFCCSLKLFFVDAKESHEVVVRMEIVFKSKSFLLVAY